MTTRSLSSARLTRAARSTLARSTSPSTKILRETAYHEAGRAAISLRYGFDAKVCTCSEDGFSWGGCVSEYPTRRARPTKLHSIYQAMAGQLAEVILEQLDDGYDLNDAAADAHYGTKMLADAIAHDEMFKFDMRAAGIDPESDGWYAEVHQVKTVLRMLMAEWPRVVRVAEILIQQATNRAMAVVEVYADGEISLPSH